MASLEMELVRLVRDAQRLRHRRDEVIRLLAQRGVQRRLIAELSDLTVGRVSQIAASPKPIRGRNRVRRALMRSGRTAAVPPAGPTLDGRRDHSQ